MKKAWRFNESNWHAKLTRFSEWLSFELHKPKRFTDSLSIHKKILCATVSSSIGYFIIKVLYASRRIKKKIVMQKST